MADAPSVDDRLHRELERFLFAEARMLDEGRWRDWDALFTDDGVYWAPLEPGQTDRNGHASLFHENAILRDVRIRRLAERSASSQKPPTRLVHVLGNIEVIARDGNRATVESTFCAVEWRRQTDRRLLAGRYRHRLVRIDDGWRIEEKRVELVDCDGEHEPFELFL